MSPRPAVLVVDDEQHSQQTIQRALDTDFDVLCASNGRQAETLLATEPVEVILCDQGMAGENGVNFLKRVRERWPDPVRLIISGHTETEDLIAGVNEAGIYHYLTKPWQPDVLKATVLDAAQQFRLRTEEGLISHEVKIPTPVLKQELQQKKQILKERYGFDSIVHAPGSPLAELCELVGRIAKYDISVLLTGESGTGKELLARALHFNSPRADNNFVVENCGALPDQLLESELFGSRKGAFTGSYEDRVGLFEMADGGSIFLDEIAETSLAFQVKLLRVLQEGEIRPLGSNRRRKVNVRVIAATNRDLKSEINAGRFREDLYYRLAAMPIHIPPLRERTEDIAPLVTHILGAVTKAFGKSPGEMTAAVMTRLAAYPWPGNVRELHNEIQRMVALAEGNTLDVSLLSGSVRDYLPNSFSSGTDVPSDSAYSLKERVELMEERILRETLLRHNWNISRTSRELGLSRVGLRSKLQRYNLEKEDQGMP